MLTTVTSSLVRDRTKTANLAECGILALSSAHVSWLQLSLLSQTEAELPWERLRVRLERIQTHMVKGEIRAG